MRKNPKYKNFYPRLFEVLIKEESAMDSYYERKFGIPSTRFHYADKDRENVVAYVEQTPIIKNPKSFEGFDNGVRIIVDKNANMYVAKYDGMFNHGNMANALIRAKEINAPIYGEGKEGIYSEQKHFLLLSRLYNTNKIAQSDSFEWEGSEAESIDRKLRKKYPQFQFYLRYEPDYLD